MASASKESRGKCATYRPGKVKVTILASEWGSSKGSVSTINTMLSIQLAKSSEVEISFFVPQCSEEDKTEALRHNIRIVKATQLVGYEDLELLSFPPDDLQIEVVVGHGVKLGRQGQVIKKSHRCKWVQVVHTDLEEIGMFKCYPDSISRGEEEHNDEVKLCEKADFVVGIGPKVTEAFRSYLRFCKNEKAIFDFTPGIFEEFLSVKQVHEERNCRIVLMFGRFDVKDFKLKGFDIAGKAIALLVDTHLVFVGEPSGSHDEVKEFFKQCGLQLKHLRLRGYHQSRERLKQLFCEADLLLMPSRTNGFGLAGLKALSAGLPVLVSKNSGFGEALLNVPLCSSFVVDSDDPDVWAAAIKNIVRDKPRHLCLDEAKRIRMLYYQKYSWPKQSDTLRSKIIKLADGKNDQSLQATTVETLKIGQRVVTFGEDNDNPIRGTVRFVGEEKDTSGRVLVGLELDERIGSGTSKWKGRQHFVYERDYAAFVDILTVISERDFDGVPGEAMTRTTSQKQDKQHTNSIKQEKRENKETFARSSSYDVNRASAKLPKKNAPIERSNSFDFSVILAAGESSKTDVREFIEKQREMLNEFKSLKLSPSDDVPMYDIERTDSASSSDHLNFDYKHFRSSPPKSEPITEQPRDFVYIDKEDYDKLLKKDKSSDSEIPSDSRMDINTERKVDAEDVSPVNTETHSTAMPIDESQNNETTVIPDPWMDRDTETAVAEDLSDSKSRTSEENSLKEPSVDVESYSGVMPTDESQIDETAEKPKANLERETGDLQQQERKMEEHLTNYQAQFEERNLMKARLVEQLQEKENQQEISQRQLLEREEQIREKEENKADMERQLEVLQQQLREKKECLANCQAQLKQRHLGETSLTQRLQEKERQQENSQRQLQEMVQQIRQKEDDKANLERQLEVAQQQLKEKEQCLANYQALLEETNLRETNLVQQLQEKELQRENSQRQLQEMEEQIREKEDNKANSERQLREMVQSFEERIREKEEEKTNLETQLGMKNQELNELDTSLTAAQQMIIELRRQESCDWVITRGEILVKDKCLGKGAWGSVNEATYCGCKVAVKQIHELILSDHIRRLFEREMNIASRCRHPCLLQFIGATNDEGSPLFVTELMELSLRALLEQRQLTETEISVISLDVSRALNYLHHTKPPIVHRDISSANVLLWRQGEQWRGKVSDYGTAKFVQQTMTVAPGALIYSAPEALSSNQTSKVDVYSFGVLLCEMCIREMPDPERREEQVLLVRNRLFRNLVRQCLQDDPTMRSDMAQIIQELEQCDGTDQLI